MADSKLKIDIRRARILELLQRDGRVQVSLLSEELGATPVTIRSDLAALEQSGRLLRIQGGAILPRHLPAGGEPGNSEEKHSIAAAAARMIHPGDTLFINSGSTTLLVAARLADQRRLNIVTNSCAIAMELGQIPSFRVLLLGGEFNAHYGFTAGADALDQLGRYQADWSILSIDGISAGEGITTHQPEEAVVDRLMSQRSKRTMVVADHTKIGQPGFTRVRGLGPDVCLVTGRQAPADALEAMEAKGSRIILC